MATKTIGIRVEAAAAALAGLAGVIAEQWRQPVQVARLVGNLSIAGIDALTPALGDAYVATDAGTPAAGTSDALLAGDIAEFDGTSWIKRVSGVGGFPPAGTRAALSTSTALSAPYTDGVDDGKVVEFSGASLTGTDTSDATDGSVAAFSVGAVVPADSRLLAFTGTVPTGSWASAAPGGSAFPWESLEIKTDANNGQDLDPAVLNVFFLGAAGADIDLNLPDAVAGALPIGTQVFVASFYANNLHRSLVRSQGADVIQGAGLVTAATRFTWQQGLYLFTYAGTGFGAPVWFAQMVSGERSDEQAATATYAMTDELPAFTPSGSGPDQTLTANANGQLTLPDGTLLSAFANAYLAILYIDPDPLVGAYNGLWTVLDGGSGGSPWVLRRHPHFIHQGQALGGKLIVVGNNGPDDEAGSAFVGDVTASDPTGGGNYKRLAGQPERRRATTTDATVTTIQTVKTTADEQLTMIHSRVTAFDPSTGDHARWVMDAIVRRVAGPTLTQKSKTFINGPVKDAAFATTDVTLAFSGDDVQIRVTGVAATTLKWSIESFVSRLA